jgi:hypothetical protein
MCCDGFISVPVFDNPVNTALDTAKDVNDTVNNALDQAGTGLDQTVRENVPGGWVTVGVIAATVATAGALGAFDAAAVAGSEAGAGAGAVGEGVGAGAGAVGEGAGAVGADVGASAGAVGADVGAQTAAQTALDDLVAQQSALYPTQTAAQTALDNLVAQQSALYPAIGDNIISLPSIASGAGKGMLTNALVNTLSGRPITAQGLITSGLAGGVGGGVADLTGSNFIGSLGAVGTNALLNKSLSPTTLASAIPNIGAGILNSGSQAGTTGGTSGGTTGGTAGGALSSASNPSGNINAVQPTSISTGTGLQTGSLLKNTKILQDLKNMYPQLNQVNPQLLAQLGYPVEGNLPTAESQQPQQSQQTQQTLSPEEQNANMYKTILANQESEPTFKMKSGGHVPEFITGHTGHYASGSGDGQSDDIKALLNEGDYVIDAESVAQLGNGSSKAGREALDDFRSSVPHSQHLASGGKIPAMIADGEYVLPSSFVSALGHGDGDKGAKALDKMRHALREHKRSAPLNKIPPPSKSPLEYLREGIKMKEKR